MTWQKKFEQCSFVKAAVTLSLGGWENVHRARRGTL